MFRKLSRLLTALDRPSGSAASPRRTALPRIEALESRWVPSTIAGVVYNDVNNVGVYQAGDPVYADNPITLLDAGGHPIASTVTDANGHYSFTIDSTISTTPATQEQDLTFGPNLTDSPQTLQLNQFDPSLGTLTGVDVFQDATLTSRIQVDNLDPVASTVEGQIQGSATLMGPGGLALTTNVQADETATVHAGDGTIGSTSAGNFDFGPKDATGSQTVHLDASKDDLSGFVGTGKASLTEKGTADVCVCGPGNLLSLVRSTVSGKVRVVYHYTPSNALRPGQYTVVQTANPPDTFEGHNTSDGVPVPPGTPVDHIPVTLPPGGDSLHNDFGEVSPARVSGFVYIDRNVDGKFDAGDSPIPGALVNISTYTATGPGVLVAATTTAADGSYSFVVPPGTYDITQPDITGLIGGADTVGNLGGFSGVDILTVYLPGGGNGVHYDFGELLPPPDIIPPPPPPVVPPPVVPPPVLPPPPPVVPPPVVPPPVVPPPVPVPPPPPPVLVPPPLTKFDFLASTAWEGDF